MVESIRAILFDLDGTLLHNDMNVFLPHYFEMLAARVAVAMAVLCRWPARALNRLRREAAG